MKCALTFVLLLTALPAAAKAQYYDPPFEIQPNYGSPTAPVGNRSNRNATTALVTNNVPSVAVALSAYRCANDGVTDVTICLQSAITAANTSRAALWIDKPGTYLINDCLRLPSNFEMYGQGAATVIKAKSTLPLCSIGPDGGRHMLINADTTNGNSNIYVHDLKLDGTAVTHNAFHIARFHKSDSIRFSNNITTGADDGIALTNSTNWKVDDNTILNFYNGGLDTWWGSTGGQFVDNVLDGTGGSGATGILVTGEATDFSAATTSQIRVHGNYIANTDSGIWLQGAHGLSNWNVVTGNTIKNMGTFSGIRLSEANNNIVCNNTIDGVGTIGIQIQGEGLGGSQNDNLICHNRISGITAGAGQNAGIKFDDPVGDSSQNNLVIGNVVAGSAHAWSLWFANTRATTNQAIGNTLSAGTSGRQFTASPTNTMETAIGGTPIDGIQ